MFLESAQENVLRLDLLHSFIKCGPQSSSALARLLCLTAMVENAHIHTRTSEVSVDLIRL